MENSTLYIVIAGLWLAVGFGIFLKKLDMPVIIGYICTGTVLAAFFKINDFDLLSDWRIWYRLFNVYDRH